MSKLNRKSVLYAAMALAIAYWPVAYATPLAIELEVADISYAYLSSAPQNSAVWRDILSKATFQAHYVPSVGDGYRARKKFRFFECLPGVACLPYPHFEETKERVVKTIAVRGKSEILAEKDGLPLKVRFQLPDAPGPEYRLLSITLQASTRPLWSLPVFAVWERSFSKDERSIYRHQQKTALKLNFCPADGADGAYDVVDLDLPMTPGQFAATPGAAAVAVVRGRVLGSEGKTVRLRGDAILGIFTTLGRCGVKHRCWWEKCLT